MIVTQGAYKQRSRDYLQQQVPGLVLIWVDAPDGLITQRLDLRAGGITSQSAAALKQDFERPPRDSLKIVNDRAEEHALAQFERCREQWLTHQAQVI